MATLLFLNGPDEGREVTLGHFTETVLGRDRECHLRVRDRRASRRHCEIAYTDGKYRVTDLGSRNGIFINSRRRKHRGTLRSGDVLRVGRTRLRFGAPELAQSVSPPAPAKKPVARQPQDLFVGKTIGGYKVLKKLRETYLGIQYKALHEFTQHLFGLKILQPMLLDKEEIVQRFIRQAQAGADFNHPNVVQTLGAGKDGGTCYIVMEYVEGQALKGMLAEQGKHGRLDPAFALAVMLQIGHALEHAYKHNIVHRDIKPSNILVAADGTAKLDNLWLAKHLEGTAADVELTGAGKPLGTLHYMAPEQIDDARNVDCRADTYALAATIYRALTGHVPLEAETIKETIARIRDDPPRPVRQLNKAVAPALARCVERSLAKDPDERYQTPQDLVFDLELARKYHVR